MPTPRKKSSGESNIVKRLAKITQAWEEFHPDTQIAGMSLAEFKAKVAPSLEVRQQSRIFRLQIKEAVARKKEYDRASRRTAYQIVSGVIADGNLGPDSPFYRAMGFIPLSECKKRALKLPEANSET